MLLRTSSPVTSSADWPDRPWSTNRREWCHRQACRELWACWASFRRQAPARTDPRGPFASGSAPAPSAYRRARFAYAWFGCSPGAGSPGVVYPRLLLLLPPPPAQLLGSCRAPRQALSGATQGLDPPFQLDLRP